MAFKQLIKKLQDIKKLGFVKTKRAHQGGVGNTLETLLGIKENNLRLPDLGNIEIKAKRINSHSMLTLSSKSPLPRGVNKILFNIYKYPSGGKFKLYTTVRGSKRNNRSFRIRIGKGKLILENSKKIDAYWPLVELDDVMKTGAKKFILVLAETKGKLGSSAEEFHYVEAYLLDELDLEHFQSAILNDRLKVDIRMGFDITGKAAGEFHDHGTGFRIFKYDYLKLFSKSTRVI